MKYLILILATLSFLGCSTTKDVPHRSIDFNFDWNFHLGEMENGQAIDFDDSDWRALNLPHDWSVEAPFDSTLEGCTAYLPGGIGWYRKHFTAPDTAKITFLVFDGIYNNADIWLNGEHLGFHPYGYSPFYYDITPYLNEQGDNVLAVRVDRTRYADSRWYTGSGIIRKVTLVSVDKLHIPVWGTYVTTPEVSQESAQVDIEIQVENDAAEHRAFTLVTTILDPNGKQIAEAKEDVEIAGSSQSAFQQSVRVDHPQLWDVDAPNMYKAVTSLVVNSATIDHYVTPFGIRTFRFDADEGFFLNGTNRLIKGVCLHHDGGLVGAAVPRGVWQRRLQKLKEAGCNAIRTAHNPPSQEFLDLCDEMGFLVQDEFFDEMDYPKDKRLNMNERSVDYITRGYAEHFQKWAETDLKTTMRRDRNHPSIFQWSIGNEIEWTYPRYKYATGYFDAKWSGNYFWTPPHIGPEEIKKRYDSIKPGAHVLAETAQKLSRWVKEMDTTRPVIANCILPSASHVTGYADALDVVGYSYRRVVYDYGHQHFPDKPIMGAENVGQWHEWKAVLERPFVSGLFLWTGIDYMGESNGRWPTKSTGSGLLDLAGFEKASWHFFKTLWSEEPHIYLATQTLKKSLYKVDSSGAVVEKDPGAWQRRLWYWHDVNEHWNYSDGDTIIVECYSNADAVELFLNNNSLGTRRPQESDDRVCRWAVPFKAGELRAVSLDKDQLVETSLQTAGEPAGFQLSVDKRVLQADGYDVAHIVAQLVDEKGTPVRHKETDVQFVLNGQAKWLGVDNGAGDNVQPFQSQSIRTHNGRCLAIIQSTMTSGKIDVSVQARALRGDTARIRAKSPK